MIAREVGVDPAKINYVAFRGGGEATAAILGGNVTIGGSGYSEFAEYIAAGKMRAVGVTSSARLKGVNVPTLRSRASTWTSATGVACTAPLASRPNNARP